MGEPALGVARREVVVVGREASLQAVALPEEDVGADAVGGVAGGRRALGEDGQLVGQAVTIVDRAVSVWLCVCMWSNIDDH